MITRSTSSRFKIQRTLLRRCFAGHPLRTPRSEWGTCAIVCNNHRHNHDNIIITYHSRGSRESNTTAPWWTYRHVMHPELHAWMRANHIPIYPTLAYLHKDTYNVRRREDLFIASLPVIEAIFIDCLNIVRSGKNVKNKAGKNQCNVNQ